MIQISRNGLRTVVKRWALQGLSMALSIFILSGAILSFAAYSSEDQDRLVSAILNDKTSEAQDILRKYAQTDAIYDLAITKAAYYGNSAILALIFDMGVSVDRSAPLAMSAAGNKMNSISFLISRGANVELENSLIVQNLRLSPLEWAVRNQNFEMLDFLVKAGASLKVKDCHSRYYAPQGFYRSAISSVLTDQVGSEFRNRTLEFFLEHGADPNECDIKGALLKAIDLRDVVAVDLLVKHGVDLNKVVNTLLGYRGLGRGNPIGYARSLCALDMRDHLIALGAQPNGVCSGRSVVCEPKCP